MKNSTTALWLFIMCIIGSVITENDFIIVSSAIFASTYLIILTIDKNE